MLSKSKNWVFFCCFLSVIGINPLGAAPSVIHLNKNNKNDSLFSIVSRNLKNVVFMKALSNVEFRWYENRNVPSPVSVNIRCVVENEDSFTLYIHNVLGTMQKRAYDAIKFDTKRINDCSFQEELLAVTKQSSLDAYLGLYIYMGMGEDGCIFLDERNQMSDFYKPSCFRNVSLWKMVMGKGFRDRWEQKLFNPNNEYNFLKGLGVRQGSAVVKLPFEVKSIILSFILGEQKATINYSFLDKRKCFGEYYYWTKEKIEFFKRLENVRFFLPCRRCYFQFSKCFEVRDEDNNGTNILSFNLEIFNLSGEMKALLPERIKGCVSDKTERVYLPLCEANFEEFIKKYL